MNATAAIALSVNELLATVSASRLNTFHTCRLKFYFHYVAKLPKRKTAAQHIGSTVHYALKLWNLARWRKQVIPEGWLKTQMEAYWTQENQIKWDQDEEAEAKKVTWNLVQTYLANTPIPPNEAAEGVEVSVEANVIATKLIGIIDLVRANGRIVEFKTTGQTPNSDKSQHLHELQTSCYSILYRDNTGKKESGIELHHLVKLKTPKLVVTMVEPMNQQREKRLFKLIDSYLEGVQRQDWVPSPNPMTCACCDFFHECRQWS